MPKTTPTATPAELVERAIPNLRVGEIDRLLDLIEKRAAPPADQDTVGSPSFRVAAFYLRQALATATPSGLPDTDSQLFVLRMAALLRQRRGELSARPRRRATTQRALAALAQTVSGRIPTQGAIETLDARTAAGLTMADFVAEVAQGRGDWIRRTAARAPSGSSDIEFIRNVFDVVVGRPATIHDILTWQRRMATDPMTRHDTLMTFFDFELRRRAAALAPPPPTTFNAPGVVPPLNPETWAARTADVEGRARSRAALRPTRPYDLAPDSGLTVSVIASLWRGRDHIEAYLDNILSQTCMDGRAELIIIDAASPDGEAEVIARMTGGRSDVVYHRTDTRIGIYAAWNLGARLARGRYLTNANLDDRRRADSLAIQAGALDANPWADVVYQDFLVTLDPMLDWDDVAAYGFRSNLPPASPWQMMKFNLPHHAPMWRRSLHQDIGFFDESYRSAGDLDFWLRCVAAGKRFFKVNEPHAVYYFNPNGVSSRSDGVGLSEGLQARAKFTDALLPAHVHVDTETFARDHVGLKDTVLLTTDRLALVHQALRDLGRAHRTGPTTDGNA
jgi:glycosyltransferase involved in cell wall biosynthesis